MDIEPEIEEDFEGKEKLIGKKVNKRKCTGKIIILIIIGNLILIAISVPIIYLVSKTKYDDISKLFNNHLKDLTKIAIPENRIMHLIKNNTDTEGKYQALVELQQLILNTTWNQINLTNQGAVGELEKLIIDFLFPGEKGDSKTTETKIYENLMKILTQKEDYIIYQLLDEDNLKTLNENLNLSNDGVSEDIKELLEDKLKAVILYGLINFSMQITYFSKNDKKKKDLIDAVLDALKQNEINKTINHLMEQYDNNTYDLYLVLGAGQEEERKRITTEVKNKSYINFVNTGLRIQSTDDEIGRNLEENLKEYYINEKYKELMKACSAIGIMDEEKYKEFIDGCKTFNEANNIRDNITEINKFFNKFEFCVETANTVIEYIKLGVPLNKIHIIRLGQKYRHKLMNEPLQYNDSDVYILFNVFDKDSATDGMIRATTVANVKALYYLKDECPNFLKEEDYNKIILVSSQGNAERQLEAFNIINNIYNYSLKFDAVIWNEKYSKKLEEEDIIKYFLESFVKSTNTISTSFLDNNKYKDDIKKFVESVMDLTEKYKKI